MPDRQTIDVVYALDSGYLDQLVVSSHTVICHTGRSAKIRLWVLAYDWPSAATSRFTSWLYHRHPTVEFEFVECDGADLPDHAGKYTRAMFGRLDIESVVGGRTDRVLYLDADTLVQRSLRELACSDIGNFCLGAVPDANVPVFGKHTLRDHWVEDGLPLHHGYFNSGVLLIDLPAWRREKVSERARDYANRHASVLPYPDQDALNAVIAGRWSPIDPTWNWFANRTLRDRRKQPWDALDRLLQRGPYKTLRRQAVLHMEGGMKPWSTGITYPLLQKYHQVLRDAGWHSASDSVSRYWQALRRTMNIRRFAS